MLKAARAGLCWAALATQPVAPAAADEPPLPPANLEAARTDPDLRCIVPLIRVSVWQEARAEPALSEVPDLTDRLGAYISDVGNRMMDRYGLTRTELDDLARREFEPIIAAFRNEAPGTIDPMVPQCVAQMEALETARPQPSPAQCAALSAFAGTFSITVGAVQDSRSGSTEGAAGALPRLLESTLMLQRARAMLRVQGLSEREANRLLDRERREVERTLAENRRSGRMLVYDKAACKRLLMPTSTAPPPAANPPESPPASE